MFYLDLRDSFRSVEPVLDISSNFTDLCPGYVAYWFGKLRPVPCSRLKYTDSSSLDYGMSFLNSSASWRIPIALQGLPALVAGLIFVS
jgi:hypothetical protein